ncbi:MAG: phosphatidate cytidylyltransferase [Phycisphaerae bacterium]
MTKRVVFGLAMIVFMASLLLADWWLTRDVLSVFTVRWEAAPDAPLSFRAIPTGILLAVLVIMGFVEMRRLCAAAGVQVLPVSGLICSALLATLPCWWQVFDLAEEKFPLKGILGDKLPAEGKLLVVGLMVMAVFGEQMIRRSTADALRRIACTLLAVAYLGIGGALMMAIRIQFNLPALVLFLVAVKFMDIGAYFIGSAIGRHKLIPWLSPGKTWEGLAGGLVVAAGMGVLVACALKVQLGDAPLPLKRAGVFGAAVGLVGQFGDLCESLLKRATAVKDSGHLLPEYGGVLDLLDSPLLAAPVGYLLLCLMA